jgi:hypothetical protein
MRGEATRTEAGRTAVGVAAANAIVLLYGVFRSDSLSFSLPFLIAPSLALLWTRMAQAAPADRRLALQVTWGTVMGAALVAAIGLLR